MFCFADHSQKAPKLVALQSPRHNNLVPTVCKNISQLCIGANNSLLYVCYDIGIFLGLACGRLYMWELAMNISRAVELVIDLLLSSIDLVA